MYLKKKQLPYLFKNNNYSIGILKIEMKWWIILLIGWVKGKITDEENIYIYLSKNQVEIHGNWFKEDLQNFN